MLNIGIVCTNLLSGISFRHVHKQICHVSLSIWKDLALNRPVFMKTDNGDFY
jgi:hypothetical protein